MSTRDGRFLELKGLTLIAIILALVALSIAFYNKSFTSSVNIVVQADRAGLQLTTNGDVRARGALVGRITAITLVNGHVEVHLALDPNAAANLPANVEARIVPTTLFGQKYIDLVPVGPVSSTAPRLVSGDVIPVDHSSTAVELTKAFDSLEPVLSEVQPQLLSQTLQAVANSLLGHGEKLGATAAASERYLRVFNKQLPQVVADIALFAHLTDLYANITPGLLSILGNSTVTSQTIAARATAMKAVERDLTTLANTGEAFFRANGRELYLSEVLSQPVMALLARYAPEFPCVFQGLMLGQVQAANTFRGGKLRASLLVGTQVNGYTTSERPRFGDTSGPACHGLPHPTWPLPIPNSHDGAHPPTPVGAAR